MKEMPALEPFTRTVPAANDVPAAPAPPPAPPRRRRAPRALLIALVLLVLAGIGVAVDLAQQRPVAGIQASGTIEATESDVSPKVGGRLATLRVHDGDPVAEGALLGTLERVDPVLGVDQARANVAAAAAQVASAQAAFDLQRATYATTLASAGSDVGIAGSRLGQADQNLALTNQTTQLAIEQAQAQVTSAQAAYAHAQIDLQRAQSLVATGDLARQQLDDARMADDTAAAQLSAARDALAIAQANRAGIRVRRLDVQTSHLQQRQSAAALANAQAQSQLVAQRRDQLAQAQAALAQARAALGLAQNQVDETNLRAPFAGYVVSHNFEVGDLVQPSSAVITIGDLAHPYLYVYVSESDLPRVKEGARADVTIDGLPGRTFAGRVTEVSTTAEFTPENVQTKEERIEYLVFRVKLQFTDTSGSLKPGLPADAVIHV